MRKIKSKLGNQFLKSHVFNQQSWDPNLISQMLGYISPMLFPCSSANKVNFILPSKLTSTGSETRAKIICFSCFNLQWYSKIGSFIETGIFMWRNQQKNKEKERKMTAWCAKEFALGNSGIQDEVIALQKDGTSPTEHEAHTSHSAPYKSG